MNIESSIWKKAVQNGLVGGVISLLLGLVGMAAAFEKTYLISGVITMGQILVLAPFLFESYSSIRHTPSRQPLLILAVGGLTGLVGGMVLAAFIGFNQLLNVRAVLYNVSPVLIALWTFNLPLLAGVIVLLVAALITGLIAAGFFLLRGARWGRTLIVCISILIVLATIVMLSGGITLPAAYSVVSVLAAVSLVSMYVSAIVRLAGIRRRGDA